MGGAISTLTTEQSVALTQKLKVKYEELSQAGEADDKIQELLTAEYNTIIKDIVKSSSTAVESSKDHVKNPSAKVGAPKTGSIKSPRRSHESLSPRRIAESNSRRGSKEKVDLPGSSKQSTKGSAKIGGLSASASGKSLRGGSSKIVGGARRRSFDHNPAAARKPTPGSGKINLHAPNTSDKAKSSAQVTEKSAGDSAKQPEHASTPGDATAPITPDIGTGPDAGTGSDAAPGEQPNADSWDSISLQPYCNVCQMAFKSKAFLDRHVKYSDLHQRNVKKAEGAENDGDSPFPITQSGKLAPTQIEGKHYKLLYSGSKFFWRTQAQVDLNFYHHILPHTIEIISYDSVKCKEMNRLYLDYTRLLDIVTDFNKAFHNDQSAAGGGGEGDLEQREHEAVSRFIIQRLQLTCPTLQVTPQPAPSSVAGSVMEFVKTSSDQYSTSPVLDKPPVVLVPISVSRRRRTSSDEINATMQSLASDRAALVEATGNAQRVANLVYTVSTIFVALEVFSRLTLILHPMVNVGGP